MIVLGFDPGLANTGYGAVKWSDNAPSLLKCGFIKTTTNTHISKRLQQIHTTVSDLILTLQPNIVAIEDIFSLIRYPKAGILLGSVLGIIYLTVNQANIPIVEIAPKEAKNAIVGYGNANKDQIKRSIQNLLKTQNINSYHATDALAIALTACYRTGRRYV